MPRKARSQNVPFKLYCPRCKAFVGMVDPKTGTHPVHDTCPSGEHPGDCPIVVQCSMFLETPRPTCQGNGHRASGETVGIAAIIESKENQD